MFGKQPQVIETCEHQWETTGAHFNPPSHDLMSASNVSEALIRELKFGITTITQQCQQCRKLSITTAAGKADVPGFAWKTPVAA